MDVDEQQSSTNREAELVKNVLEKCKFEWTCGELHVPLKNYLERTAYYTGMSKTVIRELDKNLNNCENVTFDVHERLIVIKALLKCYLSKQCPCPNLQDVYRIVKDPLQVTDIDHFSKLLNRMGFNYRRTSLGEILMEDMKLTFHRYDYMEKIRRFKAMKTNIYYLDERVIDETLKFPKPDFNKINSNENATHLLNGYYFYHVLSDKGLENYLFTNKKCKDVYMKWVLNILLKMLSSDSTIVIDDNFLHGELVDNSITRYHSKSSMINWLKLYNVPHSINMHKSELYELISKTNKTCVEYKFDKLLKAHGFDVLRIPFGCKNLSPSSLLWERMSIKQLPVKKDLVNNAIIDIEGKVIKEIEEMHSLEWKVFQEKIGHWEEQFIDIDARVDDVLDNIMLK